MKHLLRGLFIAVLIICCNFQSVFAQPMQQMPVDKNVRIGKLDNGLTYYIRHNALPEKRVEFYIAQKVGSILEEPQQRGLAHFLEHMAFNGTKHFPGDETGLGIIPWCETKGIKFGTNLNAYTSVDQTVYNISNVPTENQNVVDSCLLILHDIVFGTYTFGYTVIRNIRNRIECILHIGGSLCHCCVQFLITFF